VPEGGLGNGAGGCPLRVLGCRGLEILPAGGRDEEKGQGDGTTMETHGKAALGGRVW
jgi:hypothetical protein